MKFVASMESSNSMVVPTSDYSSGSEDGGDTTEGHDTVYYMKTMSDGRIYLENISWRRIEYALIRDESTPTDQLTPEEKELDDFLRVPIQPGVKDTEKVLHILVLKFITLNTKEFKGILARCQLPSADLDSSDLKKHYRTIVDVTLGSPKHEVTWGRIIALFALGSSLSVKYAKSGGNAVDEFIKLLSQCIAENPKIVKWVHEKGGWDVLRHTQLFKTYQRSSKELRPMWTGLPIALLGGVCFASAVYMGVKMCA